MTMKVTDNHGVDVCSNFFACVNALVNALLYCWSCWWIILRGWLERWPTNSWLCCMTVTLVTEWQQKHFLCLRQCSGRRHYFSRVSVHAFFCMRLSFKLTLLATFLGYLLTEFDQTFTTNWLCGKDERIRFGVKRSIGKVAVGQICSECTAWSCSCHMLVEA